MNNQDSVTGHTRILKYAKHMLLNIVCLVYTGHDAKQTVTGPDQDEEGSLVHYHVQHFTMP